MKYQNVQIESGKNNRRSVSWGSASQQVGSVALHERARARRRRKDRKEKKRFSERRACILRSVMRLTHSLCHCDAVTGSLRAARIGHDHCTLQARLALSPCPISRPVKQCTQLAPSRLSPRVRAIRRSSKMMRNRFVHEFAR